MPVESPEPLYRLDIPLSTLQEYQKDADARHEPLEKIVRTRLHRCRAHRATRPLYFDDNQRHQLEFLLSCTVDTAEQAIDAIAKRTQIEVSGTVVQLTERHVKLLRSRFRKGIPIEQQLRDRIIRLIEAYLRGEVD